MKKKDIIDLILSHYENDPRLFFHKTIEVLKEFQEDGDWGHSSVGRAPRSQRGGRRFDPGWLHQMRFTH